MSKKLILAALGALSLGVSSNANAALVINVSSPAGGFENLDVVCGSTAPCAFSDLATFVTPVGYQLVSATISSVLTGTGLTDIDFTSVTLNGVEFDIVSSGVVEFRNLLNQSMIPGGTNTLAVSGITGGDASYSGSLTFAAVPEPSTWMMMIFGIGAIGSVLRRRRAKVTSKAAFA